MGTEIVEVINEIEYSLNKTRWTTDKHTNKKFQVQEETKFNTWSTMALSAQTETSWRLHLLIVREFPSNHLFISDFN